MNQRIVVWRNQTSAISKFVGKSPERLMSNNESNFSSFEALLHLNRLCNKFKEATDNFKLLDTNGNSEVSSLLTGYLFRATATLLECNRDMAYMNFYLLIKTINKYLEGKSNLKYYSTVRNCRAIYYSKDNPPLYANAPQKVPYPSEHSLDSYFFRGMEFKVGMLCVFINSHHKRYDTVIHKIYIDLFGEIYIIPEMDKTLHVPVGQITFTK